MRSRLAVGLFGALLLTGCGSDDACDRPLPYVTSSEGGELVVPEGLNPPPASRQKRIPPVASDRRERSNPCSVGPPILDVIQNREANAEIASKNAERSPPSPGIPGSTDNSMSADSALDVGQMYKSESVEDTVEAWITSWGAGDAPSYLSYYATDFASKDGSLDREGWLQRRQQMITESGPSSIAIRDMTVEDLPGGRKLVRVIQDFVASDGTKASVVKLIEMTREFDAWRIRREQVVEVLSPK